MTRVLALEWAGTGVTVNAICPGAFGTEMNRPLLNDPVKYKEFVAQIPMGRWGEVHELAGAAVYLASEASSFMTGALAVRRRRLDGSVGQAGSRRRAPKVWHCGPTTIDTLGARRSRRRCIRQERA